MTPEARTEIVAGWVSAFGPYRMRTEQAGHDVWLDLLTRLARVSVSPTIARAQIEQRRARGWTLDQIGPVLDALAMETHRAEGRDHPAKARELAAYARALFDVMAEREPCPLPELAANVPA